MRVCKLIRSLVNEKEEKALQIFKKLRAYFKNSHIKPMTLSIIEQFGKNPFLILISCLLSLRAKDTVTLPISGILFRSIRTPQELVEMPLAQLEKIIRPIGFYKVKAQRLKSVSQELINRFGGNVPRTKEELLSINGVGQKTANLVLGMAFDIPAICVDVHVHRISNRLGLVKTKTPEETEQALMTLLPKKDWIQVNWLLVALGQTICLPRIPLCSKCPVYGLCERVGVVKNR